MTGGNLQPEWENAYWRVVDPFDVYARVSTCDSNTYFGSSKALGTLYEKLTAQPGDEIHALVGGVFLVTKDGDVHEVQIAVSEKHPFEKTYLHRDPEWPLERLARVDKSNSTDVRSYREQSNRVLSFEELRELGATVIGHGIDWLLPAKGEPV